MQRRNFHSAAVVALSIACYVNSVGLDLVFDDNSAIVYNSDVKPNTPLSNVFLNDFWGVSLDNTESHGSYRPLCILAFRLNYWLFGVRPFSYHAVNIVLHSFVSLLVYRCLALLSFPSTTCFVAAVIFAVHPIHTEAVAGVVGQAELLSALFFLLAIILYVSSAKSDKRLGRVILLLGALLCIPAGALSKEIGVTVAAILVYYELAIKCNIMSFQLAPQRLHLASLLRVLGVIVTTVAFLLVRLKLMPRLPEFLARENPASHAPAPIKQLTFAFLVPLNAKFLLHPWTLAADWSMASIDLIGGWGDSRNFITALFFVALFFCSLKALFSLATDHTTATCLCLMAASFIPSSNLFFPVGFVIAERILYLPSIGWCGLIAIGFERILMTRKKWLSCSRTAIFVLAVTTVVAFSARTFIRNLDWSTELSLYRSGIKFNSRNIKFYLGAGDHYEQASKIDEAFAYYYKAVKLEPGNILPPDKLAQLLRKMNRTDLETRVLRRLVDMMPPAGQKFDMVVPFSAMRLASYLLGTASLSYGQLVETERLFEVVKKVLPHSYITGYVCRGEILFKLGRFKEAMKLFHIASQYNPQCSHCYYAMAVTETALAAGDVDRILSVLVLLETALLYDSEHYHAMHAYALLVEEYEFAGYYSRARQFIKDVLEFESEHNETICRRCGSANTIPEDVAKDWDSSLITGVLEAGSGNFEAAARYLSLALNRQPNSEKTLNKLARVLHENLNRSSDALLLVERLVILSPEDSRAWALLGYVKLTVENDNAQVRQALKKSARLVGFNQSPDINTELCRLLFGSQIAHPEVTKCLQKLDKQYPNNLLSK